MNRHEIVPNYFYDVCSRFAYFILEALGEKKNFGACCRKLI